jgi:signal transduction histidine kinase/HAMP domain-containing protein
MLFGIRWGSLRTKIIAWAFVPAVFILGIVAVVIYYAYQEVAKDLVIERNRELTSLAAGQISAKLHGYADLLDAETRTLALSGGDSASIRDALAVASNRLEIFDAGVLVLDTFGVVVAAVPDRPEIIGEDWSDRSFYHQVLHARVWDLPGPAFSGISTDGPGGADVILVAVPILGLQNEFLGLIVGLFHVSETADTLFYDDILGLGIGESGSAYLVDASGRAIYHSDSSRIGNDLATQPLVGRALNAEVDALRTRSLEGQEIVASFAPVPDTSWGLVIEESWAALTVESRTYQRFLLLLLMLGVVVPMLVVAVGVTRITQPIRALISAAQEVAKGNFGQVITAETGDEVEELAEQFNLMSAQLNESYKHLEKRVAHRTQELAALNKIAAVVSRSLDLQQVLDDALETTLMVTGLEAGGIYLLQREDVLTVAAHKGLDAELVSEIDHLKVGEGFSGRVVQTCEPMVVTSLSTDPRLTRSAVVEAGFDSVIIVPLVSRGKVMGSLFGITRRDRQFSPSDIDLMTSIGHHIGVAVENARLFAAEQRRAEQFRLINKVGQRLTSLLSTDDLLDQMAKLIRDAFDYYLVEIGLIAGEEVVFMTRASRAPSGPFQEFRIAVGPESVTGWVATSGDPLLVPDVALDPRYVRVTATETRSELAVPMMVADRIIGVLNVESDRLNAFDESDLVVLQSLANQAATAIENARLFDMEQRRAEQFRALSEVGRHITSILDVDELLDEIVHLIRKTFGYYLITVGLVEGGEVVFKAGVKTHWDDPFFHPPPTKVDGEGITAWVAATGEPILAPDVSQDPRYLFLPDAAETRSELAVPLQTQSGVIGVLNVESDQLNAFDESDLAVLQSLARQAAVAIENARLYRQAQQLAVLEERNRLARDLHDSVTQALYAVSLYSEAAIRLLSSGESDLVADHLHELRDMAQGALREMRLLVFELRPPILERDGLVPALEARLEAVEGRAGLECRFQVEGDGRLPPQIEEGLYGIAREALNNILNHAQASTVAVSLRQDQLTVVLEIRDDGIGFDPDLVQDLGGMGLTGMKERAMQLGGRFVLRSSPGSGTLIRVEVDR